MLDTNTLTDRARQTGALYNYLDSATEKGPDGVKRAYVTVNDDDIQADPIPAAKASIAQMYGKSPTIVADMVSPMALISKFSPEDAMFPQLEEAQRGLIRSALRKIVDEA